MSEESANFQFMEQKNSSSTHAAAATSSSRAAPSRAFVHAAEQWGAHEDNDSASTETREAREEEERKEERRRRLMRERKRRRVSKGGPRPGDLGPMDQFMAGRYVPRAQRLNQAVDDEEERMEAYRRQEQEANEAHDDAEVEESGIPEAEEVDEPELDPEPEQGFFDQELQFPDSEDEEPGDEDDENKQAGSAQGAGGVQMQGLAGAANDPDNLRPCVNYDRRALLGKRGWYEEANRRGEWSDGEEEEARLYSDDDDQDLSYADRNWCFLCNVRENHKSKGYGGNPALKDLERIVWDNVTDVAWPVLARMIQQHFNNKIRKWMQPHSERRRVWRKQVIVDHLTKHAPTRLIDLIQHLRVVRASLEIMRNRMMLENKDDPQDRKLDHGLLKVYMSTLAQEAKLNKELDDLRNKYYARVDEEAKEAVSG